MADKQLFAIFSGRVQGVGFRYSVEHFSRSSKVTGYVKNLPDGNVELLAEGDEKELMSFFNKIINGPLKKYISDYNYIFKEPIGTYERFVIDY